MGQSCSGATHLGHDDSSHEVLVLFGSQTGTAEKYARTVSIFARAHGLEIETLPMDAYTADKLKHERRLVVFICSTYGAGEFPSNAQRLWKSLCKDNLKLPGLRYVIFGLGNSSNELFNQAAKNLDTRLQETGATPAHNTGFGDELAEAGHDTAFRPWLSSLWKATGTSAATCKELKGAYKLGTVPNQKGALGLPVPSGFVEVPVKAKKKLTKDGAQRDAYLMQLDLQAAGQSYQILDHVRVMPQNRPEIVNRVITSLKLQGDLQVCVQPAKGTAPSVLDGACGSVSEIITKYLDVSGLPSRSTLDILALRCKNEEERQRLEDMATDVSKESAYTKVASEGVMSFADVLEEFPSISMSFIDLLSICPLIQPRVYSIASDPDASGKGLPEFAFMVERREDGLRKRELRGLATDFLAGLGEGQNVAVEVVRGVLSLPDSSKPLVALALSSGIGPVRAILQRRARLVRLPHERSASAPISVYFGFRRAATDFLFQDELEAWKASGVIDRLVPVASHDQKEMLTPMNKLEEDHEYVGRQLVNNKGVFLYCGLGGAVPLLVERGLRRSLKHSTADYQEELSIMRREGRLLEEHYSPDRDSENAFRKEAAEALTKPPMFCFQCEQTMQNKGCTSVGVCGKTPHVAALQDLTVQSVKLIGHFAHRLRTLRKQHGLSEGETECEEANRFTLEAMFSTLTNVNNDPSRFDDLLEDADRLTKQLRQMYTDACKKVNVQATEPRTLPVPPQTRKMRVADIEDLAYDVGVHQRFVKESEEDKNVAGVCEMLTYGLKGLCAYADHAMLGHVEDQRIYEFVHEALAFLVAPERRDLGAALQMCLKAGEVNALVMQKLYEANSKLGVPEPTEVPVTPREGKGILISGHDLFMLKSLLDYLKSSGSSDVLVYTHGEMLPAHSYKALKETGLLAGHFGGAWQRQAVEFPHFPGAILATTNCLTEPKEPYKDRMFTVGAVGWPGCKNLGTVPEKVDWKPLVESARGERGFRSNDKSFSYPVRPGGRAVDKLMVGFGHEAVLGAAPTIIEAIKAGAITRFHLIGGCDGFEGNRSYYSDLVEALEPTSVILTLGCGKFRVNDHDKGTIGDSGIPRILDMGQCNDSWSAVQVALKLAEVLECEVKDLPLSLTLSWFEQKAVAVLLTCLHLGLKPIRVGPSLPAFVTPDVLSVLVKDFGLKVIGDPDEDAKEMAAAVGMA
uniref:Hydroxylamine reductase n=1 Tax=Chromera velia CCMP2878 TaxID=1169474 RepID=A0A0G4IEB6_9ALVE|eukprot:Cvel_13627.t1-p1 / transcript=Cvel_13627.t1 / gene=Cvel_13627 / organism=Chromera_velia_CCMP2878 / gene_product=Hydroxylamine reductase, putative / transcript_product=Hydroxylamine reductase, putative / location=Cvel_scaffold939:13808-21097(+) / protein_length=1197 / sequence_SO=supercontig / SO=protein_coding / is_pseudo=false